MKRTTYAFALLAVVGTVVIAGCGGGSSSSSAESASIGSEPTSTGGESATGASTGGGSGTIAGGEVAGLGTVLVDSSGQTVYLFTEDKGTTSVCYGGCEEEWPPVVASGKPTAGEGATSSALGTTKRKDGTLQVTYEGHPLYTFADDKSPGEANGQGDDGVWWVVNEAGTAVETSTGGGDSTTSTESTTTGSEPAAEEEESSGGGGGGY